MLLHIPNGRIKTAPPGVPVLQLPPSGVSVLINVTPGRVSQYITEGKLTADAFDGSGCRAKVRVEQVSSVLQNSLKVGFENSLIGIPFGSSRRG